MVINLWNRKSTTKENHKSQVFINLPKWNLSLPKLQQFKTIEPVKCLSTKSSFWRLNRIDNKSRDNWDVSPFFKKI